MTTEFLITAFVTLIVIIDPIALAPLFLALTQGMSAARKRTVAIRACGMGIALLLVFGAFGETLLDFIGISIPAFRIAGGILLFITALDMLFERRTERRKHRAEEAEEDHHHDDPSIFPIAIPLMAGPGAITTMILLVGQAPGDYGFFWVSGVMILVVILSFIFFLAGDLIERILGKTGITVITRLLGMLLAALAVQFVLEGVTGFFGISL